MIHGCRRMENRQRKSTKKSVKHASQNPMQISNFTQSFPMKVDLNDSNFICRCEAAFKIASCLEVEGKKHGLYEEQ